MRSQDAVAFSDIAATTSAFSLIGGLYGIDTVATGSGTLTLERLGGDGSTWITVLTAITATSSYASVYLPPGQYRVAVATFTAVYVQVVRIPFE